MSRIDPLARGAAENTAWMGQRGSLITGNLPGPHGISSRASRRLKGREFDRRAIAGGRMITYAPTPASAMILLITAVVIPPMLSRPVAARGLAPLRPTGSITAGFRSVCQAAITAATDPKELRASATRARVKPHPTTTQAAVSSSLRWTGRRSSCDATAVCYAGSRARARGSPIPNPGLAIRGFLFARLAA